MMDEFNEAMFKQDLSDVSHFIGDTLQNKIEEEINNLKNKNQRQIYDEINVKNTYIINRDINENKEVVTVEIISRYMDYIIDIDTGELVSGDDTRRIEKTNILIFEKKINIKKIGLVRRCPGCGASISVNTSGKCEYCGAIFNQEDYDYILTSITVN